MSYLNSTEVNEFILVGLTDVPELQVPLFIAFTFIYFVTLVGNLGMIALIFLDPQLHTPMYFFLSNLSLVDCIYSSAVTPKVMSGLLTGNKVISHDGCAAQMFFFVAFASVDCFLLAVMAYDRHAAICKPLYYTTTMRPNVCKCLVISCYIWGFTESSIHTVHHFFCDIPPILALSCSDIHINEVMLFILASFNVFFALFIILTSYIFIFITILRMHSAEGQQKAFSTCASHLTAVSIFYGTVIFMYLQPNSSHSMDNDQMASVFYTIVVPMLNPLVYSLRNKEVNRAFRKAVERAKHLLCI
uniref:Olfactory receptor n=1 Tax=Monodelphis domestica TaxID=13616 RepID=F6YRB1_MONDO